MGFDASKGTVDFGLTLIHPEYVDRWVNVRFRNFVTFLELGMQTRLKQIIYVSEKTNKSSDSLTDIYDISQKNNSESETRHLTITKASSSPQPPPVLVKPFSLTSLGQVPPPPTRSAI